MGISPNRILACVTLACCLLIGEFKRLSIVREVSGRKVESLALKYCSKVRAMVDVSLSDQF